MEQVEEVVVPEKKIKKKRERKKYTKEEKRETRRAKKVARREKRRKYWRAQRSNFKRNKSILWFVVPAALFTIIFSYIPMFGVLFAFKDPSFDSAMRRGADIIGALKYSNWTLETFKSIFNDNFWLSLKNSVLINLIKLVFVFPLSILIAIQLSEMKNQKLSKLILIIICIPNFLSWTVVIKAWTSFFDPDIGFLGKILSKWTNGEIISYYEGSFKPLFVFYCAWKGAGWGSILYYAAIMSIDKSYYESATIEGANKLQKAFYLTIPAIGGTIALMLVMMFSGFTGVGLEQLKLMLDPTNYIESQQTLDYYIYELSIGRGAGVSYVQAAALGVFNGLVGLALLLGGNALTTKTLKRGLW